MEAAVRRRCNLTEADQNQRLRMGVIAFTLTLMVAVLLLKLGVGPAWRLLLFVPFGIASNGLFMGLFKT